MAVRRVDVGHHVVDGVSTSVAVQQPNRRAGISCDAASFVIVNVGESVAHDFVARARVNLDRDLVGHRARRAKQRGFVSREFSASPLQFLNALVFPEDIVAHRRVVHGLAHAFGGQGDGVASQVDQKVLGRRLQLAVVRGGGHGAKVREPIEGRALVGILSP